MNSLSQSQHTVCSLLKEIRSLPLLNKLKPSTNVKVNVRTNCTHISGRRGRDSSLALNSPVARQTPLLKTYLTNSVLLRRINSRSTGHNETGKIALWKRLAVVASVGGCVAYTYYSVYRDIELRNERVRYEEFKKAELGGDWTLTDHHGQQRGLSEFRGQWVLMYFGFTHCPDICPEELEKLVSIVHYYDKNPKLPSMMPIFITLDPERDNPAAIKDYLAEFKCPRLLGFTAESESTIREVATKYRAYFSKGPADEDNDYIVDHTIIIYLINPKGEFVNYFDRSRTADNVIKTVTDHIQKYNEMEGIKN